MQLASDIQRAWTEGGSKVLLSRGLRKAVRPLFNIGSLVFIECDLLEPMTERRDVPGIVVREATIDDAPLFQDRETFVERLSSGHRCFMGIEETTGKLTNYRWVQTSATYIPELQRYLLLKPGEVYIYDLKTLPEFRRRGIDAFTRHWIYTHLRDEGYTKVLAYIHGDNAPSLKASRILLKPIARIWYIQLRGSVPLMIGRLSVPLTKGDSRGAKRPAGGRSQGQSH
jgi:ribosomal protein S18 acetylase RimI-like enzyme